MRESGVAKAGDVRADLGNLRKTRAAIALTTLNLKALLVVRVVSPRQVDLRLRHRVRRQIAGRRRRWCRSRCRRWSRRRSWRRGSRWCRCRRWSRYAATARELERADACAPIEAAVRRNVFLRVPESTVINRINGQVAIVAPTIQGAGLAARPGEYGAFSLSQLVERIGKEPPSVTYLWINR